MNLKAHVSKEMSYSDYPSRLLFLPNGISRLEKLGRSKFYPKNQIVVAQGSLVNHCYIVKKGRVIASEITSSGEERVYNFMEEGSLLMEANMLFNKPSPITFKTTMASELVCISKEVLLKAIATDQQLTLDILESISNKFLAAMDQIRQECYHNVEWKICNLLLIFAERYGVLFEGKTLITEKVSQQMLSNLLGINRITTVRTMKELKQLELIEQVEGYYCIQDIEKLKQHMMDILFEKR